MNKDTSTGSEAYRVYHLVSWLATRKRGTKKSSEASDELTTWAREILKQKDYEFWRHLYYD